MTQRITDFRTRYGSCAICVPFINCHSGRTRFAQTCPSVAVTDTDLTTEPHLPSWNLLFFVSCQRLSQKSFPTFYPFPSCTVLYRVSGVPPRHPNRGTVLCGAVQGNGSPRNLQLGKVSDARSEQMPVQIPLMRCRQADATEPLSEP